MICIILKNKKFNFVLFKWFDIDFLSRGIYFFGQMEVVVKMRNAAKTQGDSVIINRFINFDYL